MGSVLHFFLYYVQMQQVLYAIRSNMHAEQFAAPQAEIAEQKEALFFFCNGILYLVSLKAMHISQFIYNVFLYLQCS